MQNTKPTKQNSIPTKEERKLLVLKAQQAKEKVFKLIVKIISWETGSLDSVVIRSADKITPKEWAEYKKHQLQIPTSNSAEKVKIKLAKTFKLISENNGFE